MRKIQLAGVTAFVASSPPLWLWLKRKNDSKK